MSETFDPYHRWLGIRPEEQPANHYRLLGLTQFEDDAEAIRDAVERQVAHVRTYQLGPHSAVSQKILNELAAAKACLVDRQRKAEYDARLRGLAAAREEQTGAAEGVDPSQPDFDRFAPKTGVAAQPRRRPGGTKRPWLRPAAIGGMGFLTGIVIVGYLVISQPAPGPKPPPKAESRASSPNESEGAPANREEEKSLEEPRPPVEPGGTLAQPEPKVELAPEPQPAPPGRTRTAPARPTEPKPDSTPAMAVEPPEEVAARVKDALAKAKTLADFRAVAVDALKLIDRSIGEAKTDLAQGLVPQALSAARKADDDRLVKAATLCVLEPGTRPALAELEAGGGADWIVYLDDLAEFDVRVGWGALGKHGAGPDRGGHCGVSGVVPAHALLMHAVRDGSALVSYRPGGRFSRFRATATVSDKISLRTPVTFRVRGDDRLLWESHRIRSAEDRQECDVHVEGVGVLTLDVLCPGDAPKAWTVWVEPRLVPPPGGQQGKLPVPDAAAQERASPLVRGLFKDDLATAAASGRHKALALQLFEKARSTHDDAAVQYAMLKAAARLALQAKDLDLVFQAIEELGMRFQVDTVDLKVDSLTAICTPRLTPHESYAAVAKALALMEEALAEENFDAAKQLGVTAGDLARKSKDAELSKETRKRTTAISKQMVKLRKMREEVDEAIAVLRQNPTDPAANAAVGKYRCLVQNRWNKGIPMLALGNDPAWKDLAVKELKGVTDPAEQAHLGDAWWALGEKGPGIGDKTVRARATYWYQQALAGLAELEKERVAKRLEAGEGADSQAEFPVGKWVNVLPSIDLNKHVAGGEWRWNGAELAVGSFKVARVMVPVRIAGSYDLSIDFTSFGPKPENHPLILTLDGQPALLVVDGWAGRATYLDMINGVPANEHPAAIKKPIIKPGVRYVFLASVRMLEDDEAAIVFKINNTPVFGWKGNRSSVGMSKNWALPNPACIGFGAFLQPTVFHSVRLRVVSGSATRLPGHE
jgi:hypothetical protein